MKNRRKKIHEHTIIGLSTAEAEESMRIHGKNLLVSARRNRLLESLIHIVQEPMFVLLGVACVLYFFLGDLPEAIMMLVSTFFVAGIEIVQETKSQRALDALRKYTDARVRVMRDGLWIELPSEEIVPGDVVNLGEGERIPADGQLLQQHDLSVEEAVLTGESLPVEKRLTDGHNRIFQGTTVASGQGIFRVSATGNSTELGKLGKSIENIDTAPTPLQQQIGRFVRMMAIIGGIAFITVLALNMMQENDFWKALLFSLTIAMALIPEEIPVAFTTFMALGSFRMIKSGILAKQPKTVESLGSATVICLDKTGTITENRMSVAELVGFSEAALEKEAVRVLEYAWWASEPDPIDAMERAIQTRVRESGATDVRRNFQLVKEYALGGTPPMMTHVWGNAAGKRVVACKGAVERILRVCNVPEAAAERIIEQTEEKAALGYRILGVASAPPPADKYPDEQDDFDWQFEGLIAFYDPPKSNAAEVLEQFYSAGIRVLMITGDHAATARNIARSVGLAGWEISLTGQEVMALEEPALRDAVSRVNVFARMFPDAKLRVVNALKANGETVAMSGDGVNDGPALKAAQIGVAMGEKGTEIAKGAASLVLLRDNLSDMVTAIAMGRRIYDNLRKAIRYIISIHLPIVLVVLLPLMFGWAYPHILLPLHVIFLELVMDPMAAVGFESEPAEPNLMKKKPRAGNAALFSGVELFQSLLQGALISAGVLLSLQFALIKGYGEDTARAFVFSTIVLANLMLALSNRSYDFPITRTIRYPNPTLWKILVASLAMLALVLYVPFVAKLFRVTPLSPADVGWCFLFALSGVIWFELWKSVKPAAKSGKRSADLVLIAGLPGTGKSTVAAAYAKKFGALHLNTDIIRRELGKMGHYDPEDKAAVYEEMLRRARQALLSGVQVVVDATFYQESLREPFRRLAVETGALVRWVEMKAPEALVRERVARPRPDSEANFKVYEKIRDESEPLDDPHLTLDTGADSPEQLAHKVHEYLLHHDG